MLALVLLSDIGSSVMFYGALIAMLYVATGRLSFVVIGLAAFVGGRLVPRARTSRMSTLALRSGSTP